MRSHIAENPTTLAVMGFSAPILANSLIQFSFTFTDSLMIAPLGDATLGGVGQGGILFNVILTFFIGIIGMFTPLAARVIEEKGNQGNIPSYFWMMTLFTVLCTAIVSGIVPLCEYFLNWMNQPVETTQVTVRFLHVMKWATFPALIYACLIQTANLYEKPRLGLYTVIIGNFVNIGLNWLFLYGKMNPLLASVEGVAWSTVITRCLMVCILFILINRFLQNTEKLTAFRTIKFEILFFKQILTKGVPRGITNLNDWFASFIMVMMVGWGGMHVAAANQVTDVLSSLMYMFPQAFCTVITIITSKQLGMNISTNQFKNTIKKLLIITISFAIIIMLGTWLGLSYILKAFSLSPGSESFTLSSNIMMIHFSFFIFYTIQFSMLAILDSFLDTKIPSILAILNSYCIVLPLAYLASQNGLGAVGIWGADGIGLTLLSIIYGIRVLKQLKNPLLTSDESLNL